MTQRWVQPPDQVLTVWSLRILYEGPPGDGIAIWREELWRGGALLGKVKAIEYTGPGVARITYHPRMTPAPDQRGGRDEFGARV